MFAITLWRLCVSLSVCVGEREGERYRAFHKFGQAKFPNGGLVLGSSQFSILPQLSPKILLDSKVVKINPKIIISLHWSKSVTHSVEWSSNEEKNENRRIPITLPGTCDNILGLIQWKLILLWLLYNHFRSAFIWSKYLMKQLVYEIKSSFLDIKQLLNNTAECFMNCFIIMKNFLDQSEQWLFTNQNFSSNETQEAN